MPLQKAKQKKKKAKKVFTCIDLPIYGGWVMVSINQSDAEFIKSYMKEREMDDKTAAEQVCEMTVQEGELNLGKTVHMNGNVIVRIFGEINHPKDYNTLVHELFHAMDFILDFRGLRLVDGSDEAYSYMLGYLMEKTMEAYL